MTQLYPFTDPIIARAEPPLQIVKGDGVRVTDVDGNTYLDAVSGLWCASLGFNPDRLAKAAADQMRDLAYYHSFLGRTPQIADRLSEQLVAKLPADLSHVFFATSGSEAVESATKIARFYQAARGKHDKTRFIARDGAYHGSGQVSAALTGMSYCHTGFGVPIDDVLRTGRPHYLRDADPGESEASFSKRRAQELDALIRKVGPETVAAFIGEPVMGAGGVIFPPDGYWDAVQEVLAHHDILLIADEIITGFGRLGDWFACETYGIQPDLMTMAKQLTAAAFPMSAVGVTSQVYDTLAPLAHEVGTFGHGMTYGGHPVGAAVALETLAIYEEMDLPAHVRKLGDILRNEFAPLAGLAGVVDVRCKGLLGAVEFEIGQNLARRIGDEAARRGVFFRIIDDTLAVAPPYICVHDDIREMVRVLRESILFMKR